VKGLRIAERWFEITPMDGGITMITEPYVHATWRSNIWHVRGRNADMLVDAGMGIAPLRDAIADLIDRPVLAVATHRHSDHIGGLHEFATRLGHALDADEIAQPTGLASIVTQDFPEGFAALMASFGTPVGDLLIDAAPREGYDPASYAVTGAPLTGVLAEGDAVDLGDRSFEVLHLPGHTPGSIGLWERATGVLFSGDAIYDGPLFDFLPESNIDDYVSTMRRLRDLPVTVVHGGHDPSFGRARMVAIAEEYVARRERPRSDAKRR
jgi:glyoxylase-like metal-dependent hydrolase (beta-lactamase superfamily II)